MYIVTEKKTGRNVLRGDTVTSIHGKPAVFKAVERGPEPGRSAKVRVERKTDDTGTTYQMAYNAEAYGLLVVDAVWDAEKAQWVAEACPECRRAAGSGHKMDCGVGRASR